MKNLVFSLLIVSVSSVFAAESSLSDSSDATPPRLGVQAGMTFSSVSAPSDVTPSNRTGLAAGLALEVPLMTGFSLQPEALFVQRGADLMRAGSASVKIAYNSLEFPLLAKLKIGEAIAPFLVAGPVGIFNFSSSVEASDGSTSVGWAYSPKTFDLGFAIGAGIDIGPLFTTIRYTAGISDLDTNSVSYQSRGVHLLGGVRI